MNKYIRQYFLVVIILFIIISGCTRLTEAVKDVTPEQLTSTSNQIANTIQLPNEYKTPISFLLGILVCIGYNAIKKKEVAKNGSDIEKKV